MQYPSNPERESWRGRFIALADELDGASGQSEIESNSADAMLVSLRVDGVAFDLVHDLNADSDTLLVECELGPPPESNEVLLGLLQSNMQMLRAEQGSFGLRRVGDDMVITFSKHLSLTDCHASALQATMKTLAVRAAAWRCGAIF